MFIEKAITTEDSVNPLLPNVLFLYSLKTSENLWFSEVFRGYKKGTLGSYGHFRKQSFSPKIHRNKNFFYGFCFNSRLKLIRRCRKDSSTFWKRLKTLGCCFRTCQLCSFEITKPRTFETTFYNIWDFIYLRSPPEFPSLDEELCSKFGNLESSIKRK